MDHLVISEQRGEGYSLLEAAGSINAHTYADLRLRLLELIRSTEIVLDMSRVVALSSSGLGVLISVVEDGYETGHSLHLMNPSGIVRLAIESTGFSQLFPFVKTPGEAL